MSTTPEKLAYDEELFQRLSPRSRSFLLNLYNQFCDEIDQRPYENSVSHTKEDLRRIIAAKLHSQLEEFLSNYERLREEGVTAAAATEYLAEHFDIPEEDLEVDNRYELLLRIYEHNIVDSLEELLVRAKMQSYAASRAYILNESLSLQDIEANLRGFHEDWNQGEDDNPPILVDREFEGENLAVLKIYQEVGSQSQQTFEYLETEREPEETPVEPELTRVRYHQLKTIRIQIEVREEETEFVFSDPYRNWRTTLPDFFESVFGVDDFLRSIEEYRSEVANEIEESMMDAIDEGKDPVETARETINQRREEAEEQVEELELPETRREDIKGRISTIEISGSEIMGDQSIETQEFRLIAGLDGLFESVDNIEQGFRDMIEKADSEKQSFVLRINGRPVGLNEGKWSHLNSGRLPDDDRKALQIFFDGEVEL